MQGTRKTDRLRRSFRWIVLVSITMTSQSVLAHGSNKLFGLVYDWTGQMEELATIDPATAAATVIGTGISNCCGVSGAATLGAGSGVLYFVGQKSSETSPRLFAVNTKTGAILSNPVIPGSFYLDFIKFSQNTGTLLGFIYDLATQTEKLATIDPITAAATPIGAGVSQCCGVSTAPTLDRASGVIYLMGTKFAESTPRLFGFNIQTGAVVSSPTISSSINLDFITFDSSTSRLLGFIYDQPTQTEKLATIDPVTAAATPIGAGASQCCAVSTAPALDRTSGVIYLMGTKFGEGTPRLFAFSTQTGAVVSSPTISSSIYLDFLEAAYGAAPFGDIDGDGKSDIMVWRPSSGVWYALPSKSPGIYTATYWGLNTDLPVPGDYDGDGKSDIAVYRPSTGVWYVLPSKAPGTYITTQWGAPLDMPVPGDYDGDGTEDIAIWRPGTGVWYVLPSGSPGTYTVTLWGSNTDIPVPGYFDADEKEDIAVYRPGTGFWYLLPSAAPGTYSVTQWGGMPSDIPAPGKYDSDAQTDIAVLRPGTGFWYILPSTAPGTYTGTAWWATGDKPVSGDYDGDGKNDVAVWRPNDGTWYILPSNSPGIYTATQWGVPTDVAISCLTGILRFFP